MVSGRDFLGPYRLVRLIRVGQHTQVWEAIRDPEPDRIAVKVLLQDELKNREAIGYLRHEAEVAKSLKHPNIIKVFEFNDSHERPFVAMELFLARNLKQDIREQSERVAHLVPEIIEQAAKALAALHEAKWIHCDVKPDNFLVSDTGEVRVIDFAIAQRPSRTSLVQILGFRSKVKGTRSYMSPEQIRGKGLDARSDIYSFGCVLFELLSGKPPFSGSTPDELLTKHLRASIPSLAPLNDAVTPEFNELVQQMLAKDRENRPESMGRFLKQFHAMRVYRTGMKPKPPAPEPSSE